MKSGRELEQLVPELRWVEDVSLAEGMVQMMPSYKLVAFAVRGAAVVGLLAGLLVMIF